MADAVENLERKGRGDEIFGAFGGSPADGVIGIAPDVECRHPDRPERRTDRAAGAIPGHRRFHRLLIAEHREMPPDRGQGNAGGGQHSVTRPLSPSQRPSAGRYDSSRWRPYPAERRTNSRGGSAPPRDSLRLKAPPPVRASSAWIRQSRAAAAPAAHLLRRR